MWTLENAHSFRSSTLQVDGVLYMTGAKPTEV